MFAGHGTGGRPSSKSVGGKPFFISETGATVFLAILNPTTNTWSQPANTDPSSRAQIRQAWWRQFLDPSLIADFPKLKGASFFEFTKKEDTEFRDFTSLGWATNQTIPVFGGIAEQDDVMTVLALKTDLQGIYGSSVIFGNSPAIAGGNSSVTGSTTATSTGSATQQRSSAETVGSIGIVSLILSFFIFE